MKKAYKMALVSALALFSLSDAPLVFNDHQNVAQAAASKKTHHKKARKYAAKKHKVAKKQATKKKVTKKLRYKKAKKHVAKKKATRKFSYKKAKKHVTKKKFTRKLRYKKAKKVVAKKKITKKHSYKKINHKKSHKPVSKKQNNSLANISDDKSQSNLNYNANSNPVENDTLDSNANASTQNNFDTNNEPIEDNSNNNVTPHDITSDNNTDVTNQDISESDNVKPNVTNSNNQNNGNNKADNNNQIIKELNNNISHDDDNNIDDIALGGILDNAYSDVSMELQKGIIPHISSDQSSIKQFAEFKFIMDNNDKVHQESEFKSDYDSYNEGDIVYDFYNKSVAESNGIFHFNPNVKYISDPFDEVKMDIKKGIIPHISSDQSPIKQFAEFQSIVENNEKQQLQSEFKNVRIRMYQNLSNRTITFFVNGDNLHPVIYHFNTNVKYIPSAFDEVKSDEIHGIKPHIASDQSPIKQFAEFEEIKLDNAKYENLLKNNGNDYDIGSLKVYRDLPEKKITIVHTYGEDVGNTYSFDPNAKLDY